MQVLPVAPLAVTAGAVSVAVLTAYFGPVLAAPRQASAASPAGTGRSRARRMGLAGRAAAILLAGVVLVAGLTGSDSATRNVAPALLVALGWPLLILGRLLAGPLRSDVDASRSVAPARRDTTGPLSADSVHPAAVTAFFAVWYLVVQPDRLRPRVVVGFLLAYAAFIAAGCILAGGRSWLERGEAVGLLLTWIGWVRHGLVAWVPPAGASLVLGIFAGGFLFGLWRSADSWVWLVQRHPAAGVATFVGGVGGTAALLAISERRAGRRGRGGIVPAASVPLVTGLALAHAIDRGFLTAVQLLPHLVADPLGRGWRLIDPERVSSSPIAVDPIAPLMAQLLLVFVGGLAAASVARARGGPPTERTLGPAVCSMAVILAAGVLAIANQSVRTMG